MASKDDKMSGMDILVGKAKADPRYKSMGADDGSDEENAKDGGDDDTAAKDGGDGPKSNGVDACLAKAYNAGSASEFATHMKKAFDEYGSD